MRSDTPPCIHSGREQVQAEAMCSGVQKGITELCLAIPVLTTPIPPVLPSGEDGCGQIPALPFRAH